jgi:hypothetical protein
MQRLEADHNTLKQLYWQIDYKIRCIESYKNYLRGDRNCSLPAETAL